MFGVNYIFSNIILLLWSGFVLGLAHALDGDHLAAVSSLVSKHKHIKKAVLSGISWGLGHTTTLVITGFILLFLKIIIPSKLALSFELLVGLMVISLGIYVIRDIIVNKKHTHIHTHDESMHIHLHSHKENEEHSHMHKSYAVGLVHGLAGSAGIMLLVLSTVNSFLLGLFFILIFGAGSIIGMALASSVISLPYILTSERLYNWNKGIRYGTGIFSIIFGLFLVIKILFFEGLLF